MAAAVSPPASAVRTASGVARSIVCVPTTAAGAWSQRPMHGAGITRTPDPASRCSVASSSCPPAIAHE